MRTRNDLLNEAGHPRASPKVSIGLPVRNGEPFLGECLDSLLAQTFPDFEVVISDNASTDGTGRIARARAARDPRVTYRRQDTNRGAAWNYNHVLALARGEYFKWAAADDLIEPTFLAECVEVLDARPDVVLCYPRTLLVDEAGRAVSECADRLHLPAPTAGERFRACLSGFGKCHPVFGLVRTASLARTARIGRYRGSDVVLLTELSLHGKFHEVPRVLFRRRIHHGSSSADRSLEAQQEFFDPRTKGRLLLPTWRFQREYLSALGRAPLRLRERLGLALLVLRRMASIRHPLVRELGHGVRWITMGRESCRGR